MKWINTVQNSLILKFCARSEQNLEISSIYKEVFTNSQCTIWLLPSKSNALRSISHYHSQQVYAALNCVQTSAL